MSILLDARALLESFDYRTSNLGNSAESCLFEDSSVMGCITEHPTVVDLLSNWQKVQNDFLTAHAGRLRMSTTKSWNVYSIHLTHEEASPDLRSKIFEIEEDFRGTRKIARTGVRTRDDIRRALLSLLPIQNHVILTRADARERLRGRFLASHPSLTHLMGDLSDTEVASRLLEAQ
jgi:hypothetical protein